MTMYTFFADPGHSWLRVPLKEVKRLGIEDQITSFSYWRREGGQTFLYLEEDCDATLFLRELLDRGESVRVREDYSEDHSRIRHFNRWNG